MITFHSEIAKSKTGQKAYITHVITVVLLPHYQLWKQKASWITCNKVMQEKKELSYILK